VSFEMRELRESARFAFIAADWTAVFVVFVEIKSTAAETADRSIRRYPSVFQELLVAVSQFAFSILAV